MKKLLALLLVFGAIAHAGEDSYRYTISERPYLLTSIFEIDSDDVEIGSLQKRVYTVRTSYDLYDAQGEFQAEGICRVFCLGIVYDWGAEIDIYDAKGVKIGLIDGQFGTTAAARFSIYDVDDNHVAIAFLDQSRSGFTLVDPERQSRTLIRMTRKVVPGAPDYWEVKAYEPDAIDPAVLRIFSAFVVDRQSSFREED